MAKTDYEINHSKVYNDATKGMDEKLTEIENTYGGMIETSDKYFQDQIKASKQWAETQKKNQQAQTDFAIEQIEQQKEQAHKDYTKEQSGSYVDWQKQSNQYGANAEQMAAQGMTNTGYSESSQVNMYVAYQNRVAVARESFTRAVLNYDNAIKDAQLQNNAALAEIAYNALKEQLALSLQGFQYKNQLLSEKMDKKSEVEKTYWQKYQDVLAQINEENKLAESVRQHDETLAEQRRQANLDYKLKERQTKLAEAEFEYQKQQDNTPVVKDTARDSNGHATSYYSSKLANDEKKAGNDIKTTDKNTIKTEYYNGRIPEGTRVAANKYGTFSNGYQPKGVAGHGKLKKTGKTIEIKTKTLSGESRTVTQNVWKSESGVLWYWEGREMTYKRVPMK